MLSGIRKQLRSLTLLLLLFLVPLTVHAVDITGALWTSTITFVNVAIPLTEIQAPFEMSGSSLVDGSFMTSDALNTALQSGGIDFPSMPASERTRMLGSVLEDGGVFTDLTTSSNDSIFADISLLPTAAAVDDAFYFIGDNPFRILTLNIGQAGVGTWDLAWEYWNGSAYSEITGNAIDDRTDSFRTFGVNTVSFNMPVDWEKRTVEGIEGFIIRARVSSFTLETTQPLATQLWYETGLWWTWIHDLDEDDQQSFVLYLGGSAIQDHHQIFLSDEGIITNDNSTIEPGLTYAFQIVGRLNFDTPGACIVCKGTDFTLTTSGTNTVVLDAAGEILTVSGITLPATGTHIVSVESGTTELLLSIVPGGSIIGTPQTIPDNNIGYTFASSGAMVYLDTIAMTTTGLFGELFSFNTVAEWDTGTFSNLVSTVGVSPFTQYYIAESDGDSGEWSDGSGGFASVASTSTSSSAGTSHTITLPAGVVDGDLLIVIFEEDEGGGITVTFPGTWTQILDFNSGNNVGISVYAKNALSEGSDIIVTTSGGANAIHLVYRITGADLISVQAPEGNSATGSSAFPDPPSLTPTGGAQEYLWIVGFFIRNTGGSVPPANYGSIVGPVAICCGHGASAQRNLNAASENPGTWDATPSGTAWGAFTLAIHPGSVEAFSNSDTSYTFGFDSSNVFARFTGVGIPQGSTISSAILNFFVTGTESGATVNVTISAIDADNAAAPTTFSTAENATRTTASVNWNNVPTFNNSGKPDSLDFTSVVQEIVDRPGWVSGNSIVIYVEDNSSSSAALRTVTSPQSTNRSTRFEVAYTVPSLANDYIELDQDDISIGGSPGNINSWSTSCTGTGCQATAGVDNRNRFGNYALDIDSGVSVNNFGEANQSIAASPGQVWSFRFGASKPTVDDDTAVMRITWRNSSGGDISTFDVTIPNAGTYQFISSDANTAPSGTASVNIQFRNDCNPTCSGNQGVEIDGVVACICNPAPNFPAVGNLVSNPSFEEVNFNLGTWTSGFIVPLSTNVLTSVVFWTFRETDGFSSSQEEITVSISTTASAPFIVVPNSGDPIPGINPGDDATIFSMRLRFTLQTTGSAPINAACIVESSCTITPIVSEALLFLVTEAGSSNSDLFYQLDTTPSFFIEDRSVNSNIGDLNLPLIPLLPLSFVGALQSTSPSVASEQGEVGAPSFADQIAEPTNVFPTGGTGANLPLFAFFTLMSDLSGVPPTIFMLMVAMVVIIFSGIITFQAFNSTTVAYITMMTAMISFTFIDSGVIPWWIILVFGLIGGFWVLKPRTSV